MKSSTQQYNLFFYTSLPIFLRTQMGCFIESIFVYINKKGLFRYMPTLIKAKMNSLSGILWNQLPSMFVSRRPVMRLRFTFHAATVGVRASVSGKILDFYRR